MIKQTPILKKRLSHAEQIADRCIHFTGIGNDACKAGVRYEAVSLRHDPIAYRHEGGAVYHAAQSIPCLQSYNYCGATCDKRTLPSPEDVAAKIAMSDAEVGRVIAARAAIVKHIEASGANHGSISCPACGALLGYSRASNGHIWANCATKGCTQWME